jgi:phosphoglycolate phosphatase-like HAD superfamily hydrolase
VILYLFDIDGTLLRGRGSGSRTFEAVFAEHHGIPRGCDGMRFGGKTDPALIDEMFVARLGRPATARERARFLDAYLERLPAEIARTGLEVLEGVGPALSWLAARPEVVLGVATGNVRAGAEAKLAATGLTNYFVLGGYGCDSHVRAELVAAAIKRGRQRSSIDAVIVVGDTVHDISAARACGAVVCAVATGSNTAEELAHADVVFASLAELPAWHTARFGESPRPTASTNATERP